MCDTGKSRNFVITKFNNNIIVLSFDHQVCFLMNIFGKQSDLPFFTQERSRVVLFTHEQNIICSQHSWTTLRMRTPLFVGSYLQVTWWAFGQ